MICVVMVVLGGAQEWVWLAVGVSPANPCAIGILFELQFKYRFGFNLVCFLTLCVPTAQKKNIHINLSNAKKCHREQGTPNHPIHFIGTPSGGMRGGSRLASQQQHGCCLWVPLGHRRQCPHCTSHTRLPKRGETARV